jgi:hypothetical protein
MDLAVVPTAVAADVEDAALTAGVVGFAAVVEALPVLRALLIRLAPFQQPSRLHGTRCLQSQRNPKRRLRRPPKLPPKS